MITTLTLNPCIDRSVLIPNLVVGGHNRIIRSRTDLGGKGINVSVVLHTLGYTTKTLCMDYMDSGAFLSDSLSLLGLDGSLVTAFGRLRENMKLYDAQTDQMTEINEPGAPIDQSTLSRLIQRLDALLPKTDILVLSGSVPPGVENDIYKTLILRAKTYGVFTVLDAAGELLRLGIEAKPDLIKPNRFEMEMLCGHSLDSLKQAREDAQALLDTGVGSVCLSLGKDGAMLLNADGTWYSKGLEIQVKGVQGAGDSLVAGLCAGHMEHWDSAETLRTGIALAQGSLLREGTLLCTQEIYEELLPKITVEKL